MCGFTGELAGGAIGTVWFLLAEAARTAKGDGLSKNSDRLSQGGNESQKGGGRRLSNPIRKRSATAARLTVLLITGWTALVVARPWASASSGTGEPAAQELASKPEQPAPRTGREPSVPAVGSASAADLAFRSPHDLTFPRRIAGRSDHAAAHTSINFSALARDEARGAFGPARRNRGMRPRSNPFEHNSQFVQTPPSAPSHRARRQQTGKDPAGKHAALLGFPGLGDNQTAIPPDTGGAVGPAHLVVALNSRIEIQNSRGTLISSVSLLGFWSSLGVGSVTDPRVIYDPYGQRWVIVTAADPETTASAVLIGVSHNSDPTAGWNLYRVPVDPAGLRWGDFPTLGFSTRTGSWSDQHFHYRGHFLRVREPLYLRQKRTCMRGAWASSPCCRTTLAASQ